MHICSSLSSTYPTRPYFASLTSPSSVRSYKEWRYRLSATVTPKFFPYITFLRHIINISSLLFHLPQRFPLYSPLYPTTTIKYHHPNLLIIYYHFFFTY
jgi:hypothetical protein